VFLRFRSTSLKSSAPLDAHVALVQGRRDAQYGSSAADADGWKRSVNVRKSKTHYASNADHAHTGSFDGAPVV
jgi:hypothetical protein